MKSNKKSPSAVSRKEKKDSSGFFPFLQRFLQQADEGKSTKYNNYPKQYAGLDVKVNFGKGTQTRIPWIAFLSPGQAINTGIYPGFFYYKDQNLLIFSFCISETVKPALPWNLSADVPTIYQYFLDNGYGSPERYGNSLVYKVYSPISVIEANIIDRDLEEIISIYRNNINGNGEKEIQTITDLHEPQSLQIADYLNPKPNNPFILERTEEIKSSGLLFGRDLLYRYTISLLAKPFVILSGLTGSGKTRLAMTFARWLSHDDSQLKVVSVGADWNNREYLFGYPNALEKGNYIRPENGVLDFLLEASAHPSKPYFLILDEMNLSYVERYFSDFLSAMESHEAITLHPDTSEWKTGHSDNIPAEIKLPANLFITGTINVDETTYMFSPKVLDRANVIEFRISEEDMATYLTNCRPLNLDIVKGKGADMAYDFVAISQNGEFRNDEETSRTLLSFFNHLKPAGAEFGYRTAGEIYRFMTLARKSGTGWDDDKLMDFVVMQKMLPRLHGSRKKMQPILGALWQLCLKPGNDKILIESEDAAIDNRFRYPLSAEKIRQMFRNARDNGFTSYAEA